VKKFGETAAFIWAECTDAELEHQFYMLYRSFKDKPDFTPPARAGSDCILCDFEGWKLRYGMKET